MTTRFWKYFEFILVLLLMICKLAAAETDLRFERISLEQGLSQSTVLCMLQDSKGFLWFGTYNGLNRYDGYTFKIYKSKANNPKFLSNKVIRCLCEDTLVPKKYIWIGTEGGLFRLDREKEEFIHYQPNPADSFSLSHQIVSSLFIDRTGVLWVGTYGGGLNKYDRERNQFIHYQLKLGTIRGAGSDIVLSINESAVGDRRVVWIGTDGGLFGIWHDKAGRQTITHDFSDSTDKSSLSGNSVYTIEVDHSENVWVGTWGNGLNRLIAGDKNEINPEKIKFVRYQSNPQDPTSLSHNIVRTIFEDSQGNLWIGTQGGGLNKFDREKEIFLHYKNEPTVPGSLSNNSVCSIIEDYSGVLWIGTEYGGLNKFVRKKMDFNQLMFSSEPYRSYLVNSIYKEPENDGGVFWIGTWGGGLIKFDKKNNKRTYYRYSAKDQFGISSNFVKTLYQDRKGNIWIGTLVGLCRLNPQTNRFSYYAGEANQPDSLSDNDVYALCEDHEGNLWIGTYNGGLNKFDLKQKKFIRYQPDGKNSNSINDHIVWSLQMDSKGILWIGTESGGLNRYDPATNKFSAYVYESGNPNSICDNKVLCIYKDPDESNILWLGTTEGLNRFDTATETFTCYNEEDGLPDNSIHGILKDLQKNIWIATPKGLAKLNVNTKEIKTFDMNDGLASNEFNLNANYQSENGTMFFANLNGINYFDPNQILSNSIPPRLAFIDFQILNNTVPIGETGRRTILEKSVTEADHISLSYKDYVFSFSFAALHYVSPLNNQYAYQMSGFEEHWNYVGNRRFATYTNLPPGDYSFRLKASNSDGVWNEDGIQLNIKVTPPFWQRSWFIGLMILAGASLIYSIHYYRTRMLQQHNRELEEKVNTRTLELTHTNQLLQQERERLDVTLRSIGDAVIATDVKGKILLMNKVAEELTGWNQDEAIGQELNGVFHIINEITNEPCVNPVERVLLTGTIVELANHTALISRDGLKRIIADSGAPIKNKLGEILGVVLVFRDITEKKRIDLELQKTSKLESLGILAGGIAHDFNNILTAVLGNVSLAKMDVDTDSNLHNILSEVEKASNQAKYLTQQLLTFSKGGTPIKKTASIKELIKESVEFVLKGSKLKCIYHIADDLWPVEIDTGQIHQVINNLVINADQAMPHGNIIEITTENVAIDAHTGVPLIPGKYIKISIKDYGIGIPKEYLHKIFDPYFTTKQKGSGLGLATCYSIIKNHSGHIEVESEPGIGTTFSIYLPVAQKGESKPRKGKDALYYGRGKILIMDDKEIVRDAAGRILKDLGYDVYFAKDGAEAIQVYNQAKETNEPIEAVIMDLIVPGSMGGLEATKILLGINPDIKIIASSGYSDDPIMSDYKKFGFRGIIKKPYGIKEMSDALYKILNNKPQDA